ncbi:hypothetical protein BDE02_02G084500 [Populus trichocarpa]|nr:hypothetical protein BDE02_02G084500 [Populus trichocarpa]
MVFCFLRSYRFTEATWEAFSLPNFVFRGVCHPGIFKPMRGIKVKGLSCLRTLVSDGESHVQPMPLVEEETGSSSSVQSTPEIEKNYVHRVYDAIAPHFSSTRFAKWPKVATFLNSLPSGSLVLDAGCGNGKYLGFNPDCTFVGCDISGPLIKICADRGHEVLVADAVNLPYRTGFGDAAISIAVLHHLSTENRRKRAIDELVRAVKKGGLILITVWAVEQEDRSLVTKWTPLNQKYVDEWIGPGSPRIRSPSSITLESIPETENNSKEHEKDTESLNHEFKGTVPSTSKDVRSVQNQQEYVDEWIGPGSPRIRSPSPITLESIPETENNSKEHEKDTESLNHEFKGTMPSTSKDDSSVQNQQEYFVPWHLPYHRAEVSGASACALENGLAKKDDKKGAVVYNRYYHVFSEGELER